MDIKVQLKHIDIKMAMATGQIMAMCLYLWLKKLNILFVVGAVQLQKAT